MMSIQKKVMDFARKSNNDDDDETEVKFKFLPVEILTEILSRLPANYLARCKCVCKFWRDVIQDRYFVEVYLGRSKPVYVYRNKMFNWHHIKDGLVVEKHNLTGKCRIRNLTTKKKLALPDPHGLSQHIRMFYLPNIDNYKLISVYPKQGPNRGGCQALTVGTDLAWKAIDTNCFRNLGSKGERLFFVATSDVLFITRFPAVESGVSGIICIEVETENSVHAKIPDQAYNFTSLKDVKAYSWDNKLSLANLVEGELQVWVLEDYRKERWSKRKIEIPLTLFSKYPQTLATLTPSSCSQGNWLWFRRNDRSWVAYHIDSKMEYIKSANSGKRIAYPVVPSLVNLDRNRPEKKLNFANRRVGCFSLKLFF